MTQLGWYGADPLMGPADRLTLIARGTPDHVASPSPRARPLGIRLARIPMRIDGASPQCGRHSKTYTIDRKTENTKVIVDGNEENHQDVTEVERETD
ncbi:MAG: hypothetical protein ACRDS9_07945 [Pseudonocardiaceae bacterium]